MKKPISWARYPAKVKAAVRAYATGQMTDRDYREAVGAKDRAEAYRHHAQAVRAWVKTMEEAP